MPAKVPSEPIVPKKQVAAKAAILQRLKHKAIFRLVFPRVAHINFLTIFQYRRMFRFHVRVLLHFV